MKTIKTLTKLLLSVMIMITSLSATALSVKAASTDGTAYAVLTDSGDLIFFRSVDRYSNESSTTATDINGNQYNGTVFNGIESGSNGWTADDYGTKVKRAYVAENTTIAPISMNYWFSNCSSLISFNGNGFNTSNVTNMEWMFYNCRSLTSLD